MPTRKLPCSAFVGCSWAANSALSHSSVDSGRRNRLPHRGSGARPANRPTLSGVGQASAGLSALAIHGMQPAGKVGQASAIPKGDPGFSPTFFGLVSVRHHAAKPENLGRPRRSRLKPACRLNACPTKRPKSKGRLQLATVRFLRKFSGSHLSATPSPRSLH